MHPVSEILDYYFVEVIKDNPNNVYILCKCPLHDSDGITPLNFSINRYNGRWKCFARNQCGSGKLLRFIQLIEEKITKKDCSRERAMEILANFKTEQISWNGIFKMLPQKDSNDDVELSEMLWPIDLEPIPSNHPWLRKRHYKAKHFRPFKVSYNRTRPDFIFFPVYFEKKLRGFTARDIRETAYAGKWDHHPGMKKTRLLYNYDKARDADYVVICEGPLDVIRLNTLGITSAVAIFGADPSPEQLALILENWAHVLIGLDNDKAGVEGATKLIDELKDEVEYITHIIYDVGEDADDLRTPQEFFDIVKSSPVITSPMKKACREWDSLRW